MRDASNWQREAGSKQRTDDIEAHRSATDCRDGFDSLRRHLGNESPSTMTCGSNRRGEAAGPVESRRTRVGVRPLQRGESRSSLRRVYAMACWLYAGLSDKGVLLADAHGVNNVSRCSETSRNARTPMNDLLSIAFFLGCLIATLGLVRACEWLWPAAQHRGHARAGEDLTRHMESDQ